MDWSHLKKILSGSTSPQIKYRLEIKLTSGGHHISIFSSQWFDFAFIPKSLEWLDIHNNKIDKIGNYYSLSSGFNLQTFDASFNKIVQLLDTTLLHGLKSIYLNNNKINKIAPESFKSLSNLSRVELQNNNLVSLESEAVITSNSGKNHHNFILNSCLSLIIPVPGRFKTPRPWQVAGLSLTFKFIR